jgi:hypothetical protein
MNRTELEGILAQRKVTPLAYSLGGGLPNERYVLDQESDGWAVYYSERGQKSNKLVFETEDQACRYLLKVLTDDTSTHPS